MKLTSKSMYKEVFRMPKAVTISGRSSGITNSFINGILPSIEPSDEEIKTVLSLLGMDYKTICCAYCGDTMTEWDHFRPLIIDGKATGYISEIGNLVPSCGKCNQSKGNKDWRVWMLSDAKLSPKTRGISELDSRIARLELYESQSSPLKLNLERVVGKETWDEYMDTLDSLLNHMKTAQKLSSQIKQTISMNIANDIE